MAKPKQTSQLHKVVTADKPSTCWWPQQQGFLDAVDKIIEIFTRQQLEGLEGPARRSIRCEKCGWRLTIRRRKPPRCRFNRYPYRSCPHR